MTNKPFIHENFLLQSETAQHLFHDHAKKLPIIDYHCHLNPQEVASDHKFRSITELWLGGDHYKWRALRTNGVAEKFITGDASDWDKFQKWAETMPYKKKPHLIIETFSAPQLESDSGYWGGEVRLARYYDGKKTGQSRIQRPQPDAALQRRGSLHHR